MFYTLVSGVVSRYRWWPRDLYYQIKSPDLTKRRDRSRGRCRSREDRELVMAIESGHFGGIYHRCPTTKLDILLKENFPLSNIQARAPTEAVILNRA